mmetsp:Transcript_2622/g.3326  ORF Transcript_2622/g.3326 Transcript_2622/m.3326 type:complete len:82 (-) Transcript_2622:832-1077(-)
MYNERAGNVRKVNHDVTRSGSHLEIFTEWRDRKSCMVIVGLDHKRTYFPCIVVSELRIRILLLLFVVVSLLLFSFFLACTG